MLKLKLKPNGSLGLQEIQCYNVTVFPDLSHISGRTSNYNSLLDGENVKVVNNENKKISLCKVDTENVKVQGKVALKITLPIKKVTKSLVLPPNEENEGRYELSSITKNYVEYNGSFSYEHNGSYLIDGKVYQPSGNSVDITTFSYIEDGYVDIGGKKYVADFRGTSEKPDIKENIYSDPLIEGQTAGTSSIEYIGVYQYKPSQWKRETKFNIWKDENNSLTVDAVLYGGYDHYIDYKGERYNFKQLYSGDTYMGYGVEIDGKYYSGFSVNSFDGEGNVGYNDDAANGAIININDDFVEINDSLVSYENGGRFVFIVTKSESLDVKNGDTIIAKSNGSIPTKLIVQSDYYDDGSGHTSERQYVLFNNRRYDVLKDEYKYVKVYDNEYRLYDNSYCIINDNVVYFTIKIYNEGQDNEYSGATPTNKIYYLSGITESGNKLIEYGTTKTPYVVEACDAVDIEGTLYRVEYDIREGVSGYTASTDTAETYTYYGNPHIKINEDISFNLTVSEKNGSCTYICYPNVNAYETDNNDDIERMQRYVCDMVVLNRENFIFQIRNDVFGENQIYPDTYLYDAVMSTKPFCTSDILNLSIFKINSYINFNVPMVNDTLSSILKDNIIKNDYTNVVKNNAKTGIVDMEKDIYYPVWKNGNTYEPITNIRFNLHFRTRQLDNWKVIENYNENLDIDYSDMSNWFITDYKYYQDSQPIGGSGNPTLQSASDLIGFINFTTNDAKNMSKKISKSFLRLSFFSTDNPQTQVLLGTSTIFMDANGLCDKAFSYQKGQSDGAFIRTKLYSGRNGISSSSSNTITDDSEYVNKIDDAIIPIYDFSKTEPMRLSSRFNVYDKCTTTGSSEGFYFYMFKEYSTSMRPTRMYMKVDFNHAGIGKSLSFMLPRRFDCNSVDGCPLYLHNNSDLELLKNGFSLKDIYKQTYIPIDVVYDDSTNKYVYYLPDSLRENNELGVDDNIMEFNLFEVKFKDESKTK